MELGKLSDGTTTIYHGDCNELLQEIVDGSVDLIFCDPPYNIGKCFGDFLDKWPSDEAYAEWCQNWLKVCLRKLKPNGTMYVMTSTEAMPHLDLWLGTQCTIQSRIVWHYDSSGVQAKKHFGSLYEPILFCVKDRRSPN